jgi:hypothetical protein
VIQYVFVQVRQDQDTPTEQLPSVRVPQCGWWQPALVRLVLVQGYGDLF